MQRAGATTSGASAASSTRRGVAEPGDEAELARTQEALLAVLADAEAPEDALRELAARPELAPVADWVRSFEPRCVEVGMALTHRRATDRLRACRSDRRN